MTQSRPKHERELHISIGLGRSGRHPKIDRKLRFNLHQVTSIIERQLKGFRRKARVNLMPTSAVCERRYFMVASQGTTNNRFFSSPFSLQAARICVFNSPLSVMCTEPSLCNLRFFVDFGTLILCDDFCVASFCFVCLSMNSMRMKLRYI